MIEQRSTEWFQVRIGKVTASNFGAIMTQSKNGKSLSQSAQSYLERIIAEMLTGQHKELKTESIQHGIETEERAVYEYEKRNFIEVKKDGFCMYQGENEILKKYVGCSPDGLIGEEGLIEIKCLDSDNFVHILLNPEEVKKSHNAQMQGQMFITGRKWVDYVVFDDRVKKPELQMNITRVMRDEDYIKSLEENLIRFCLNLDYQIKLLNI